MACNSVINWFTQKHLKINWKNCKFLLKNFQKVLNSFNPLTNPGLRIFPNIAPYSNDAPYCRLPFKGKNFRRKKISRISQILAKFAKINSFFDPQKCWFAKINSREIFQNWWFAKIDSREISHELIKDEYWSFCLVQCLLDQVFLRPRAILSFV